MRLNTVCVNLEALIRVNIMVTTILVVEDSLTEQFVLRHLLQKFGYRAVIANSAEEALAFFESGEETFAAVLMDLTLPGFSGFVCAKQIRQMEAGTNVHTPIIALTGRTEQSARDQAREVGMDAYFVKPYEKEELRTVLAQYINANEVVKENALGLNNFDAAHSQSGSGFPRP